MRKRDFGVGVGWNSESRYQWLSSERRKNGNRFPVPRASHQRFVAGEDAQAVKWQQMAGIAWLCDTNLR
jgi:hypothetical protein